MTLAATRLIALHKNKGKSVAACLKSRTDYAQNPDKTQQGELVSSYECSPLTVDEEFMLSKRQYELVTGRRQKSDVIAYQIRQSFKPGEITAEEANKVGYELAMRFTKGKYAFIVATHTDREHIHNHIIYNSTALDSTRKFRDFLLSGLAVQRLSDLICLEHQLSVIEIKPYRERQKRTLYPPKERIQGASFVKFQKFEEALFLSYHRKTRLCTHRIICIQCNALQPLSSYSGVQKVCKNVQTGKTKPNGQINHRFYGRV